MSLVLDALAYLLIFVLIIISLTYVYFRVCYTYWKNRGVPILKPTFPFGNFQDIYFKRKTFGKIIEDFYFNTTEKYVGVYVLHSPIFILKDPDLIKNVLVKDFSYFHDRGLYCDEKKDPLSGNLFRLSGTKWEQLRSKLTPTFTSGKIKMMFPTLVKCGEELHQIFKESAAKGENIEIKEFMARYTTDTISSVAFGIESNSLKNPDSVFRQYGKLIFSSPAQYLKTVVGISSLAFPILLRYLRSRRSATTGKFITDVIKEVVEYREKNLVTRNDFLQLLIQLKNKGNVSNDEGVHDLSVYTSKKQQNGSLTLNELIAQANLFFLAGFETSSMTMTFVLYELALHPDIQDKVHNEILQVFGKYDNQLTYESINDMPYLDAVILETLRKYPPSPNLNRECTNDYHLEDDESSLVLEKGTKLIIPVLGMHNDPKYFPNPKKFDPDRFSAENKHDIYPYCYLPFGEGPRNCIGLRMGKIQMKIGLVSILRDYKVEVCPETLIPMKFSVSSIVLSPAREIILKVTEW